ncbi:AAA family ATPase [Methylococcus capsulatus]|nr:AAA family ATPase [Methylococcus sp. BF19-07]MDF9393010.1 AAA family ATPase [Methylococcus capsulatus]
MVEIIHAESIQPKPIRWLWRGWLARGKLHVIAGAPGTGKTSIALALAATITTAGRWPDGSAAEPGNVLIWSGEDDPHDTLVPRLLAAGADRSRCYFVGDVADMGERRVFDPAKDMAALAQVARRIGDIRLMIVDPIVSAVSGDSHKNAEVRRGLAPLVELAGKLDCALLGVSHFSKGTAGRDPLERVTGSLAFGALARIVFAAFKESEDDGGGRVFCRTKSNIGPDVGGFRYDLRTDELPGFPGVEASSVLWGEAVDGSARDLLARAEAVTDPDERTAVGEACGFLQALLADGPVSSRAVRSECEGAGHAWSTVRRAQKQLGVIVSKGGGRFGGGKQQWTWALPDRRCSKNPEDARQKTWATSGSDEHLVEGDQDAQGMDTFCNDESPETAKIYPWSKEAAR